MTRTHLGRIVCLMLGCAMMLAGVVLMQQRRQERRARATVNVAESLDNYLRTTQVAQELIRHDTPYRDIR